MEKPKNRPWKVLKSEYLARKPWFTVRHESLELPDGRRVPDYYVFEYPDWINITAITRQGEFVLIDQYRHALGETRYEIPAGVSEASDASMLAAAQRELAEETGYGGGEWRLLMTVAPNPATQNNLTYCFLATGVEPVTEQRLDPTEDLRVHLAPAAQRGDPPGADGRTPVALLRRAPRPGGQRPGCRDEGIISRKNGPQKPTPEKPIPENRHPKKHPAMSVFDLIHTIYFSPTGTTRKVAEAIAKGLKAPASEGSEPVVRSLDLTHRDAAEELLAGETLAVLAAPVYGGHVAPEAVRRMKGIRGSGTPAVVAVVYGNRAFEHAAEELARLAEEQGFRPIAAGAFVGEHSYSTPETNGTLRPQRRSGRPCAGKSTAATLRPSMPHGSRTGARRCCPCCASHVSSCATAVGRRSAPCATCPRATPHAAPAAGAVRPCVPSGPLRGETKPAPTPHAASAAAPASRGVPSGPGRSAPPLPRPSRATSPAARSPSRACDRKAPRLALSCPVLLCPAPHPGRQHLIKRLRTEKAGILSSKECPPSVLSAEKQPLRRSGIFARSARARIIRRPARCGSPVRRLPARRGLQTTPRRAGRRT